MALADRIKHRVDGVSYGDIPIHEWTAAMTLLALGEITRQDVVDTFSLTAADETGLDALIATYTALSTKADKVEWLNKLECAGIFYQNGVITETKYKNILGL